MGFEGGTVCVCVLSQLIFFPGRATMYSKISSMMMVEDVVVLRRWDEGLEQKL